MQPVTQASTDSDANSNLNIPGVQKVRQRQQHRVSSLLWIFCNLWECWDQNFKAD